MITNQHRTQGGKTYNKWYAYGQAKSANMLFAISLAQKLGVKHNLQAYSLHPGVIHTNLANHLDFASELAELGTCLFVCVLVFYFIKAYTTIGSIDRAFGNPEGWTKGPNLKPLETGVATHIYAAFDPNLRG